MEEIEEITINEPCIIEADTSTVLCEELFVVVEEMPRLPTCEHLDIVLERSRCWGKHFRNIIIDSLNLTREEFIEQIQLTGSNRTFLILQFNIDTSGRIFKPEFYDHDPDNDSYSETSCYLKNKIFNALLAMPNFTSPKQRGKKVCVGPFRVPLSEEDFLCETETQCTDYFSGQVDIYEGFLDLVPYGFLDTVIFKNEQNEELIFVCRGNTSIYIKDFALQKCDKENSRRVNYEREHRQILFKTLDDKLVMTYLWNINNYAMDSPPLIYCESVSTHILDKRPVASNHSCLKSISLTCEIEDDRLDLSKLNLSSFKYLDSIELNDSIFYNVYNFTDCEFDFWFAEATGIIHFEDSNNVDWYFDRVLYSN